MSLRIGPIVIVLIACVAKHPPATKSFEPSACPTLRNDLTNASATKVGDSTTIRRPSHHPELLSIIIDGRRAVWNYPVSQMDDYTSTFKPSLMASELKSVVLVKPDEAERLYGTCPGVPLFVIETKSGNWHPADSTSRR